MLHKFHQANRHLTISLKSQIAKGIPRRPAFRIHPLLDESTDTVQANAQKTPPIPPGGSAKDPYPRTS